MEVNEAIKFLEKEAEENFWHRSKGHVKFAEKDKEIIKLLESLEKENEKLKKENEAYKAYKGIVEEIENDFGNGILQNENGFGIKLEHLIEIKKQKYLGGGE